jgi:hypothetical protein
VGSIPDWVIRIFHSLNPSGISLGGGGESDGLCVELKPLPPSSADCLEILEASTSRSPRGPVQACNGVSEGGLATLEEIKIYFP